MEDSIFSLFLVVFLASWCKFHQSCHILFVVCKCFEFEPVFVVWLRVKGDGLGEGHRLTHYQTTNFRLFQTERVCRRKDENFKFNENGRKLPKRVENTVGKGEIAPFPTVFLSVVSQGRQKVSLCRMG